MKFIKVTNQVSEVNRINLEKLGVSTKRDNEETIGQFGSGIKFAPIAAIRKGMRWIFTGHDSRGDYTLEYIVKDDDGIPSIFYKYDDYEKVSSFSADAGILSWENPFQIYREVVANAIDEAKISGLAWSIDIVDESEIKNTPGEFSIFISATDEMMEIHNNFDMYFSVNRTPVYVSDIYPKYKLYKNYDEYMRVYCKGVLVFSTEGMSKDCGMTIGSFFDYEFDDLELNEERTIKNAFSMGSAIGRAFSFIDDENIIIDLIKKLLDVDYNTYELHNLQQWQICLIGAQEWKKVFDMLYPDFVLIKNKEASINAISTIKSRGFNPKIIEDEVVYEFFATKDIKTVYSILGESFKYDYTMEISKYPRLIECINIIKTVWNHVDYSIERCLGVLCSDEDSDALGMVVKESQHDEDQIILISEDHIKYGTTSEIIATILHEVDHFLTGESDGDFQGRIFRNIADERLSEITLKMYSVLTGTTVFGEEK